jgi:dihydroflavonol-4-reductase
MTCFVTGATGFVGAHVARALVACGEEVRCLVRPLSRRDNLRGVPVELVIGDLLEPDTYRAALRGCRTLYHCAADYRLFAPDPQQIRRTNVEGSDALFQAAAEASVDRIVYTSSVGALGLSPDGSPANEETPVSRADMIGHYKRSKYDAERVAQAWFAKGLPIVIVNPSTPIGELDIKPTPTGKIIVDFLAGRMPAYVDCGLNLVDVRDVALGHLLAAERGQPGQKYILGHRNMTLREMLEILARTSGITAPKIELPHWIPVVLGALEAPIARLFGRTPRVPLEGARMAAKKMYFDCEKAVRCLGVPQSPIEDAMERAVHWFKSKHYA